jgi:hypothetical protein
LFGWVLLYIISDSIMLALVSFSYLFFKRALYKYAYFKFIVTSILLGLNFLNLGYGAFIIYKMPTEFETTDISR